MTRTRIAARTCTDRTHRITHLMASAPRGSQRRGSGASSFGEPPATYADADAAEMPRVTHGSGRGAADAAGARGASAAAFASGREIVAARRDEPVSRAAGGPIRRACLLCAHLHDYVRAARGGAPAVALAESAGTKRRSEREEDVTATDSGVLRADTKRPRMGHAAAPGVGSRPDSGASTSVGECDRLQLQRSHSAMMCMRARTCRRRTHLLRQARGRS